MLEMHVFYILSTVTNQTKSFMFHRSFEVIGNIFKSFVGAGILGLPFGFLKAGLWVRISFLHLNNLADFVIAKAGLVTLLLVGIVRYVLLRLVY